MSVSAFPSLTDTQSALLRAKGIDPDRSLSRWLAELTPSREGPARVSAAADRVLRAQARTPSALTRTQRLVLSLVARGLTGTEIADALLLSPYTVKEHMKHAIVRLDARNRVDAVLIAIATGQLTLDEAPEGLR